MKHIIRLNNILIYATLLSINQWWVEKMMESMENVGVGNEYNFILGTREGCKRITTKMQVVSMMCIV